MIELKWSARGVALRERMGEGEDAEEEEAVEEEEEKEEWGEEEEVGCFLKNKKINE